MVSTTLHPLNIFSSTLPQVEQAAQVLPVLVNRSEADLAHQTLPLRVEVILPGELVEVRLEYYQDYDRECNLVDLEYDSDDLEYDSADLEYDSFDLGYD